MAASDVFVEAGQQDWVDAGPGVKRRMLGFNDGLMMVEVAFENGAVGAQHSHPHLQVSYVAQGSFEMQIGDRRTVLKKGDSYMVPANVQHGCTALEPGVLIDAFTPARQEFL
jgi:quercetin dioxygenase-like cupin family protein